MKMSILETRMSKTYLGFTLEINSKKLQYSCLQRLCCIAEGTLTALSILVVVSVTFFTVANYRTAALTEN